MALAIFDLDNTLIDGDSDYLWGIYLSRLGMVDGKKYEAANEKFYDQYNNGQLDIDEFLKFSTQPLVKNNMDDLLSWRNDFIEKEIKKRIFNEAKEIIADHKANGDTLLVITATNTFITRPIVDLFSIDHLIGIELEIVNKKFTGKVMSIPSFKEGKVKRLNQWLKEHPEDTNGAFFYSDSSNDLPLLSIIDNPIVVNPDDNLKQHAFNSGWKILKFRN
tara:strand:- start:38060 stop:38716 length:657 start_codon:yes stop_codon:yes gene_type:complete